MKKIYLFATLLAFLGFAACEDVYDHMAAPPQSYEQETQQTVDGFTFALGSGISSAVVLSEQDVENATVLEAIETTATPALAEGATLKFEIEASNTEDFTTSVELPSVSANSVATITAADLNEAVKSLYGKAPNARDIYLRATYYIIDGSSSSLMPNPVVLGPITVTPLAPVIETEYYLIGDMNGWDFANLNNFKFNHPGGDVYENSVFSILVNLTGEVTNWKVVPKSFKESASWDGVLGNTLLDGNTELSGELAVNGGAMRIEQPGWAKITLNMLEYTYTIEIIGEMNLTLYVPGGHQGWAPDTAPTLFSRNYDFKYEGYVYFPEPNTEFKFTSQPGWEGINYGNGGNGNLSTDGGAGNLSVSEAGYYKLDADLSSSPYTYNLTKTEWGLIGDATAGGWDNSTPMTFNPETGVWTVTTTLSEGAFKFRANNGWDINLGGNLSQLSYGGDNITGIEAATYLVTLDLSDPSAYKATLIKQ
ncbi:MAG: SusF/SusE family outer membrane protein [Bacteroidia bacterium]|nr:SusF/SusE family outer membrane protein [Bacteroidia bacterium]